jgi:hypothetical protein
MAKVFPPHTQQECTDAAPDVCYELLAMVEARDLATHAKKQTAPDYANGSTVMQNCALESFLLHYRALREFFNDSDKKKADDIKAVDYLPAWQTSATWLNDATEGDRIHKRLAHLSTLRTTLDSKWDFEQMERNVSGTFEDFISKLPQDRQAWFSEATTIITRRKPVTLVATLGDSNSTVSVTSGMPVLFPDFK